MQALIDTGFDGELVVPEHLIRASGDEIPTSWTLADGSQLVIAAYEAEIRLGHLAPIVGLVLPMGGESLVGHGDIDHFSVTFDHGRRVIVYE